MFFRKICNKNNDLSVKIVIKSIALLKKLVYNLIYVVEEKKYFKGDYSSVG